MQYFLPLLSILLVGLKLTGYIQISWWLALAPVWMPALIGLLLWFVMMFVVVKWGGE
jgi:hypothetical protein